MKCLHILYLYMGEVESIVLKVLSTRCSVQLCRAGEENGLQKDGWDLVVLQDAVYCLLQTRPTPCSKGGKAFSTA